jgi:putative MATE family efflux protein
MLMIGSLGSPEIAGVGIATRIFFVLILVLFGISTGSGIFISQYWEIREIARIRKVMGMSLWLSLMTALIIGTLTLLFSAEMIGLFTSDREIIRYGADYLSISSWGFILTALIFVFAFACRSTGHTILPLIASFVSMVSNTLMNYAMIYGHWGSPAMGVGGAALATVISRVIELGILMIMIYGFQYPHRVFPVDMKVDWGQFKTYLKTVLPVTGNELVWVLGMTMYSVIWGRMGSHEITAMSILAPVDSFAVGIFLGLSSASSVMLGNALGASDFDRARQYAARFIRIGVIISILTGIIIIFSADIILGFYKIDETVYRISRILLLIAGAFLWLKIINMIMIVGILRSGGDVRYSFFMDTGAIWLVGIPVAAFLGLVLTLPLPVVYLAVMSEEVIRGVLGIGRFLTGRWIRNLT